MAANGKIVAGLSATSVRADAPRDLMLVR